MPLQAARTRSAPASGGAAQGRRWAPSASARPRQAQPGNRPRC